VNNEVEIERDESMVRFEINMEPVPKFFKGTKWRSYLKKVSEDTVLDGLESSQDGLNYSLFGETKLVRIR
jgi:hypothetical protein